MVAVEKSVGHGRLGKVFSDSGEENADTAIR
jgi:hypothetical protein